MPSREAVREVEQHAVTLLPSFGEALRSQQSLMGTTVPWLPVCHSSV